MFRIAKGSFAFSRQGTSAVDRYDVSQLHEFLEAQLPKSEFKSEMVVPMHSTTLAIFAPMPCPLIFFDRQNDLQSCGRRALNNMIGSLRFIKDGTNSKTVLNYSGDPRSVPLQMSTLDLCRQFQQRFGSYLCNPNEW
jgi:hypothetical protein